MFNDARCDRQLDDRDDDHATLALYVELGTAALERWLRDSDEDDAETSSDVLGMLGRMAARGHADARRVLREYVAYGRFWPRAVALALEAMPLSQTRPLAHDWLTSAD